MVVSDIDRKDETEEEGMKMDRRERLLVMAVEAIVGDGHGGLDNSNELPTNICLHHAPLHRRLPPPSIDLLSLHCLSAIKIVPRLSNLAMVVSNLDRKDETEEEGMRMDRRERLLAMAVVVVVGDGHGV